LLARKLVGPTLHGVFLKKHIRSLTLHLSTVAHDATDSMPGARKLDKGFLVVESQPFLRTEAL
jgi:hypothetical protein